MSLSRSERNRRYYEKQRMKRGIRTFVSDGYPLRLRLQRLLCTIRQRCRDSKRYGQRGIKCALTFNDLWDAWHRDNAASLHRASIDRIDNDGDYEPSNIRFIELADNIRRGVIVRDNLRNSPQP